jgi:HlyD family secretion protein
VRNDQHVEAGDVVMRLDETQTRANLAVVTRSLDELHARMARLDAEKDGAGTINFPDDLLAREARDPQVAHILAGERKLFNFRLEARNGQKAQLGERASQLRLAMDGLAEQVEAKTEEMRLIQDELKGELDLWSKNLVSITRVNALKRCSLLEEQ